MLIFNITFLVSDKVHNLWLEWVRQDFIPFMLNSTYFSHPQVARIITSDKEDGTSFSIQFQTDDMKTLKLWNKDYSSTFQENCSQTFGTEVLFFTTVLEKVE
jgi:hypothetical protein